MVEASRTDVTFRKPSMQVIERVADAEGAEPHALDPPLYDAIDPAALDRLCVTGANDDDSPSPVRVSFHYHGYDLVVDANGRVELR